MSVIGEFRRLREQITPGSRQVLEPSQGFGLRKVTTPRDAVETLLVRCFNLVEELAPGEIVAAHPLIGALSTVLAHPYADRAFFKVLQGEQRERVERVVAERPMHWSASGLEWQLAQYVAVAGERVPLNQRVPLTMQLFDSKTLTGAWNGLLNLEVLIAWGLVPEVARWAMVREVLPHGTFSAIARDPTGTSEPGAVAWRLGQALSLVRSAGGPIESWPRSLAEALTSTLASPPALSLAALSLLEGHASACASGGLRVHLCERGQVTQATAQPVAAERFAQADWPAGSGAWAIIASPELHRHEPVVGEYTNLEAAYSQRWASEPGAADVVLVRVSR